MDHPEIRSLYEAFNRRDIDAVLVDLHPDVEWPNGWEGGYVKGHDEIRDYWTRQWSEIDPTVFPKSFEELGDGRVSVEVHQVVKDKLGHVVADSMVTHVYRKRGELFDHMEIRDHNAQVSE